MEAWLYSQLPEGTQMTLSRGQGFLRPDGLLGLVYNIKLYDQITLAVAVWRRLLLAIRRLAHKVVFVNAITRSDLRIADERSKRPSIIISKK